MNGRKLGGEYTANDPWDVGGKGRFVTCATDRASIDGGSYLRIAAERSACNCVMDDLMFLDTVPTEAQIRAQYSRFGRH